MRVKRGKNEGRIKSIKKETIYKRLSQFILVVI